jgi:hypothetical protein
VYVRNRDKLRISGRFVNLNRLARRLSAAPRLKLFHRHISAEESLRVIALVNTDLLGTGALPLAITTSDRSDRSYSAAVIT